MMPEMVHVTYQLGDCSMIFPRVLKCTGHNPYDIENKYLHNSTINLSSLETASLSIVVMALVRRHLLYTFFSYEENPWGISTL